MFSIGGLSIFSLIVFLGMKLNTLPWLKARTQKFLNKTFLFRIVFSHQKIVFRSLHDDSVTFEDREINERLKDIKHVFDLRDPAQFFMNARSLKRHIIFHAGPTNSGKTYHAIKQYMNATSGIYCGPLRMLAGEIYRKTNEQNVPCDMVTGEERLYSVNENSPANHVSCTVELCSVTTRYDVAVIDEIQMLRCYDRGWAWTRALLGVPAQEVHVCGEEAAIDIVKKLLSKTQDTFEIRKYKRLTPLRIERNGAGGFGQLQKGDCVISFSQRDIYKFRTLIERSTGLKCAVIYGNLPSNVRFDQARQFNDGLCDVLIASDAIGMGMNLNIQRIIFSKLSKFDGIEVTSLTPHHIKQIAGRAGRYRSIFEVGYVTGLQNTQMKKLRSLMKEPVENIKKAGILPSFPQFELLSMAMPGKDLLELMEIFEILMQLDKHYFLCDVERFKMVAREIRSIPLTLSQSYLFSIAPMNILKSSFVCSVMKKFAYLVSDGREVPRNIVEQFVMWPPKHSPKSISELQHLEYIHEILDLYRWLSYRFIDVFTEREEVIQMQVELEDIISRAVDANLKHYKKDNQFHAIMRKRKKRFKPE